MNKSRLLVVRRCLKLHKVFCTHKWVAVWGSSKAIPSSLSPTEEHFTVTPSLSNRHVQFPASEHKTSEPLPAPSPAPLTLWCGLIFSDVVEIKEVHKAKTQMPKNIICCYFLRSFTFVWIANNALDKVPLQLKRTAK